MAPARKAFGTFAIGAKRVSAEERARRRRQKARRIKRAIATIDQAIVASAASGDDDYVRTLRAAYARLQSLASSKTARSVFVVRPLSLDVRRVLRLLGFSEVWA